MNYRSTLIKLMTFAGGLYFFLQFVLPGEIFGFKTDDYDDQINLGFQAIGALTFGLGIINILAAHGAKIAFLKKGWINSFALILGLGMMMWVTTNDWLATEEISGQSKQFFVLRDFGQKIKDDFDAKKTGVLPVAARVGKFFESATANINEIENRAKQVDPSALSSESSVAVVNYRKELLTKIAQARKQLPLVLKVDEKKPDFSGLLETSMLVGDIGSTWADIANLNYESSSTSQYNKLFYDALYTSLGSAMFALLGFYIASAAYRAFRIRSVESGLMMVAAFLVMLGQIPFGLWIWSKFPEVRLWILRVPNAAAFRAISIGAGVASLVMAFRMWLSIESESFGKRDEQV
jgi:hypothetical protein